ncbi:serine/threonine-protein phosphatase 2A activator-like [Chrysoperla carnea]|uniref:serine/threonine-protein phosphatase 2A activator-like n=1 Tax=Chrysoperla carnea TaxID=189513 RepID=UPI001D084DBB|nr:serine/threonine-protein phosphatase 2A activator-like [Chrysoperla carnea]
MENTSKKETNFQIVGEDHEFVVPEKSVKTMGDMSLWEKSEAYFEYMGFILALNDAVKCKPISTECPESQSITKIIVLLNKIDALIAETPPVQQPQRFGNQAFRVWHDKLSTQALTLLQEALPPSMYRAIPELIVYLVEGFGNSTRIDYGTGHELAFLMFLCCLFKIGAFLQSDKEAVVLRVFNRYLEIVRKLQQTYRMEPAGSHGVWSLDDYQFVPFIWGSSQLINHKVIEPAGFLNPKVLEEYGSDYLFLGCIKYINSVKTGPFAEHSNQLWGVSGVPSWSKVNGGLIKMYKVEVLSKFPVVQHIYFGSLLPFKAIKNNPNVRSIRTSMAPPPPAPQFDKK